MTNLTALVAARTDVGRVRTNNEDAYVLFDVTRAAPVEASAAAIECEVGDRGLLLALSDGMGGHQAGEVASNLALTSLCGALTAESTEPVAASLDAAVRAANAAVFQTAQSSDRKGMGATLTAVLLQGTEAHLAQVGDSRLYLLRGGQLRQLSRDQSLVQLLVDGGALSPEEAKHSPQKNVILQAMGLGADVKVAIVRLQLRRDDVVLLCCDGLSNAIADDELQQILVDCAPLAACERLISLANERGGEDNITAIVARIAGSDLAAPDAQAPITSTFEVLQDASRPPIGAAPPVVAPAASPAPQAVASPAPIAVTRSRLLVGIVVALVLAIIVAYWLRR